MIRTIIVAGNPTLRQGLRSVLESSGIIEIIGGFAGLDRAQSMLGSADVLVLCLDRGDANLTPFFSALADLETPLLVIGNDQEVTAALPGHGPTVWGILGSDALPEAIISALYALNNGLLVAAPELIDPLLKRSIPFKDRRVDLLSPREGEILELLARGLGNKQISGLLEISENTVKFHTSSIYQKLKVTNRTEAVRLGIQQGLISL